MMEKQLNSVGKNVCEVLYRLMLFLAVFDGIRSNTPVAEYVTVFKEVSTFSLLIMTMFTNSRSVSKNKLYYSNVFFFIYLVFLGTFVILVNDVSRSYVPLILRKELPSPYAMHFKNIESFLAVYVLLHYEQLTGRNIRNLMLYFVYLCVAYIILTLVVYFYFPNTNFFKSPWYGRISIGYPTSDSQILVFALAYLIFGNPRLNVYLKILFVILFLIGIIMNATAIGLLSIAMIVIVFLIQSFLSGKIFSFFSIKNILNTTVLIVLMFAGKIVVESINDKMGNYPTLLDTKIGFISDKLSSLFDNKDAVNSDIDMDISEKVRKTQIEQSFLFNTDIASLVLGGPISLGTLIENENYFLIRSYGYLGFILYYFWLLLLIYAGLRNIRKDYAWVLLSGICILIITNSAIATTYLYGVAVSFGLIVSYYYTQNIRDYRGLVEPVDEINSINKQ